MPHSIKKRKQRLHHKKTLDHRIKDIHRLAAKHKADSHVITLPNVALGDLRRQFNPKNQGWDGLHPAIKRMVSKFKRYSLDSSRPLIIKASDGGLLLVRTHLNDPAMLNQMAADIQTFPPPKNYKFKGIKRSDYMVWHLGTWAPYSKVCMVSRELRDLKQLGFEFLSKYSDVWTQMSRVLGQYAPGIFKQFQLYPLNEPCERFCGAWAECVVNNGGNNPNQTEAHRDVKESQYGYSCVLSFGDYTGGALVLFELGIIVEMEPGDLLLFPDSLITHCNEPAEGNRMSIVTFTQENVCDYWHRTYNMKLRRQLRSKQTKKKPKK